MKTELCEIDTSASQCVDVSGLAHEFCRGVGSGFLNAFVPHATAGLALMETGSGSEGDLQDAIGRLLPREDIYRHSHGSKGHGADHVLPAFLSPSLVVPVVDGAMQLGTWQSIVFVDLNVDNPIRQLRLSFLAG
jgi:secondary thiamine-phosphate synthase enzyme